METAKIRTFGSLYLDGTVLQPGVLLDRSRKISLGNTVPGMELEWLDTGSRLIATSSICRSISWEQLNRIGYIFGHPVLVDGMSYLCRCLKVGVMHPKNHTEEVSNEWDDLLDRFGADDGAWHWDGEFFWGQESYEPDKMKMLRGGSTPRNPRSRGCCLMTTMADFGFRPVLEPLPPMSEMTDAPIGQRVKVYGPLGGIVDGVVASVDGYDLVLKEPSKIPPRSGWVVRRGKTATINHDAIQWMETIEL